MATQHYLLHVGVFVFVVACSAQNREGPLVTCNDIGNGATNACEQGIIATCAGGKVTYRACDDGKACEQSWQAAGKYRCQQTESLPKLTVASPGNAGAGGAVTQSTGGSSGRSGAGRATSDSGSGGKPDSAGSGQGAGGAGTVSCGVADVCVIASTDSVYGIHALAQDADSLYFADGCGVVKHVPKTGGFQTEITKAVACSNQPVRLAATSTHIFVLTSSDQSLRVVRLSDGVIVTSKMSATDGLGADADAGYWGSAQGLQRYTIDTAKLDTLTMGYLQGSGLSAGQTDLFWVSPSGTSLQRLPKNASGSSSPTAVSLSPMSATDIAVDGTTVYFVDLNGKKLGKVATNGAVSTVVDELAFPRHVAVNSTHVYWTDAAGLHSVPKNGGETTLVEGTPIAYEADVIIADDDFVFVGDRTEVRRVPK
jgi:hypothetical protein